MTGYEQFCFMIKKLMAGIICVNVLISHSIAQQVADTTRQPMYFSGSLGITNNGFSIIPSFSFNDPAVIALLSWKKKKFSFDPEFRITHTGKKGSILFWFRYHAVNRKRFAFTIGAHPAVNWFPTIVNQSGISEELLRLRRFFAWELAPSYKISKHWSTSIYYLQGNGLQKNGPRTTHFINLNTTISRIALSNQMWLTVAPAIYYLYLDGNEGIFFTASASLGSNKSPFLLQSTINQKLRSAIPDTRMFMWNIGVAYSFRRELR